MYVVNVIFALLSSIVSINGRLTYPLQDHVSVLCWMSDQPTHSSVYGTTIARGPDKGDEAGEGTHPREGKYEHRELPGSGPGPEAQQWHHERERGKFFAERHRRFLHDYYTANNYAHLPPGLKRHLIRQGALPPGLERQPELPPGLQRPHDVQPWTAPPASSRSSVDNPTLSPGQVVSPSVEPYLYPVDPYASQQLGPLPANSSLYMLGRDVLLINNSTKQVLDVLRNVY